MINENFKPAEWKYVETPYAEMLKHGMMQQANYDEAVGAMAEYDAKLGALKRIDESTYQNVASKYDQDFRDMYDQYGGDWGAMKNKVKQRLGAETANPFYNLNRAHVEEYEKMQEFNKQLAANGKSPLTYSRLPMSLKKDGKYIDIKDIKYDIERKLEWDNKEREIAAFALQDETTGWAESLKSLNREDYVNKFIQRGKGSTTQIGMPQIDKKLDEMYTNFMDSDEGKQKYRALANSEEYKMKDATPADIEAKIKLDLLDTAKMKIHKSTSIDYDVMKNDDYGRGGSGQQQVNPFSISTTNSPNPINERPTEAGSIIGKLNAIKEIKYGKSDKNNKTSSTSEGSGMAPWRMNWDILKTENKNLTKDQQIEITKIFNSILSENSTLNNIAKANGIKLPPVAANIKDVEKIMNDPVFRVATNAFDNLNKYYVGKDVIINQNDEAAKGVQNAVVSKPEDYEFKTADGGTTKIKVKDRDKAVYRLDLVTGDIKTTIDGKDIIIDATEIQNTAGDAMKNIIYTNKAFQSDHDGERFLGAGNVPYETVDAARYANSKNYDPKTGMIRIATSTGKIETIPISSKLAIGYAKNNMGQLEPVLYTYDDVMGGLAGQTLGATGTGSKVVEGEIK